MQTIDHYEVIRQAWEEFDDRHKIKRIYDVSAHVSTNQVYRVYFFNRNPVYAKLSDYGNFEHFKEDHIAINNLANNLEEPYENFLARSLVKRNEPFIHKYYQNNRSAWVDFYNPLKINRIMPRRLEEFQIKKLGRELARFHKACVNVSNQLPSASKSMETDIYQLIKNIRDNKLDLSEKNKSVVLNQCDIFLKNIEWINSMTKLEIIPVFVDWNIGNFSVTSEGRFFSRWDYDWFRQSSRVVDFYFFSRVVSNIGDRTVFSYLIDPLMEERFILFLKDYHQIYPLTEPEVRLIGEAYRFFILNYVIKDGNFFFRESYAQKLQREAFDVYFNAIDSHYYVEKLLKALKL